MTEAEQTRIPTHMWVEAELRRLSDLGIGVYVAARGDKAHGLYQGIHNNSRAASAAKM